MPETLGHILLDTVEQAEQFGETPEKKLRYDVVDLMVKW